MSAGAATFPIAVGDAALRSRAFDADDVAGYRTLSGDPGLGFGPSRDETPAEVVPGPLLAGMISDLLGTSLPGLGTMWLRQEMTHTGVVRAGETVTAAVRVVRLRPDKGLVNLETTCRVAGEPVLTGEALVMVPGLERRARTG